MKISVLSFLLTALAIFGYAVATKVTIDLHRKDTLDHNSGSSHPKSKPTITLANSETGIKVVAKGNRITTSLHSDNTQHIEHIPLETKYFKKGDTILEHLNQ